MKDRYGRTINYLRISLTDRCNLKCWYCMPQGEVRLIPPGEMLSPGEIVDFSRIAAGVGINKIRLTGGEPLLKDGIIDIVRELASIEGITDLSMTTNGILLGRFAEDLAAAGLSRVNISLDTLDPEKYREITGGGEIEKAIEGIKAAQKAWFSVIKINCVVDRSSGEPDAAAVLKFAKENNLEVRFIRKMDLASGQFWAVEGGNGGICRICNRLRLTCDGRLKPCLFSDQAFSIRTLGMQEAIRRALDEKPESGQHSLRCHFYNVGG